MKVDGMNRDDDRSAASKTISGQFQIFFHRQITLRRFEIDGALQVQNSPFIHKGRQRRPAAVLSDANSLSPPRLVCLAIAAVSRSTCGMRKRGEQVGKSLDTIAD